MPISAHFDTPVSTYLVHMTLPEGLQQVNFPRDGLFIPSYYYGKDFISLNDMDEDLYNSLTEFINYSERDYYSHKEIPSILWSGSRAFTEASYGLWSHLTCYWDSGEYDEMFYIYLKATEEFNGGQIKITTQTTMNSRHNNPASPSTYWTFVYYYDTQVPVPGDVCDDDWIDVADCSTIMRYLLDPESIEDMYYFNMNNADVDGNGVIDIGDAAAIWDLIIHQEYETINDGIIYYYYYYTVSHGDCIVIVSPSSDLIGDLNGDNEVNLADVNLLIDGVLTDYLQANYDINNDGEINITDICELINIILKNR